MPKTVRMLKQVIPNLVTKIKTKPSNPAFRITASSERRRRGQIQLKRPGGSCSSSLFDLKEEEEK